MQSSSYKILLLLLILLAAILLTVGLVAPIITFRKFIFIQNTFSILTGTWNLLKEGQLFLFVIITLFSIILPIFKLGLLAKLVVSTSPINVSSKKILELLHRFGKWSMLDVFVVAILVVVVKLGAIADVEKHIGLYAYAAAAILIMLITHFVVNVKSTNSAPDR
ncbi:MAG: paraquat-inducible protein A [Gammaproteobacteria bacterium]|jgi:paraquat-inducible protein A|nr:paraquat-inducible protein A [Gammaproteobacteria bacterium]